MDLSNLNLNLLVHLEALLSCRSVSKAAEHLQLSQPTVSAALGQLRRHFGDDLLQRSGNRYELTPLVESLYLMVSDALADVERVFAVQEAFEPETSRREFVIIASDFWLESLGPAISRALSAAAPRASLRFELAHGATLDEPLEKLRHVDRILAPHGVVQGLPHVNLLKTEWRCIVSADNNEVGEVLDLATLGSLPWVVVGGRSSLPELMVPLATRQLRFSGLVPRVEVTVGTFSAVPTFVRGTDRVAIVHRSTAEYAQQTMGLRVFPVPFSASALVQAFWWHPHRGPGKDHQWLRQLLISTAERIVAETEGFDPA
jgi:DNA-binding transcriptional LysR family regulator